MPTPPSISDAEWRVMEIIWSRGPSTAADVVAALARETAWNPRTIKTLLGRLLRKKALGHKTEGNRYLYFAKVSRDASLRRVTRSFLDRLFNGDAFAAVLHMAQAGDLTDDQIRLLKKMIREEKR